MNNFKNPFNRLRRRRAVREADLPILPLTTLGDSGPSSASSVDAGSSVGESIGAGLGDGSLDTTRGDASHRIEHGRVTTLRGTFERWIIAANWALDIVWKCTKVATAVIGFAIFVRHIFFDRTCRPTTVDVKTDIISTVPFASSAGA